MRRAGSMPAHLRLPVGTENAIGQRYQTGILAPARHESLRAGLARVGVQSSIFRFALRGTLCGPVPVFCVVMRPLIVHLQWPYKPHIKPTQRHLCAIYIQHKFTRYMGWAIWQRPSSGHLAFWPSGSGHHLAIWHLGHLAMAIIWAIWHLGHLARMGIFFIC